MASTPEQFARKLARTSTAVQQGNRRALKARADITKEGILAAGLQRTRQVKPSWVRLRMLNASAFGQGATAELRLHGGFAVMTQMGSYKSPQGWYESPRNRLGKRRTARLEAKGISIASALGALSTPYGPRASIHHPPNKARPFFREGIDASRDRGAKAYVKVQRTAIANALK